MVNVIAAASSKGDVYFTLNRGKTNSLTFIYFLTKLINKLSESDANWREKTVFMIDNATYHRSHKIREQF